MKIAHINNFNKFYLKPQNKQYFKGFSCREFDFEIKNLYELPCPICSTIMLQRKQIDNFVNAARNAKGETLIALLSKYRKYFHKNEASAAEILTLEAQKYPDKNIGELAKNYLDGKLSIYSQEQQNILRKAKEMANNLPLKQRRKALEIIEKYETICTNKGYPSKHRIIQELKEQIQGEYSIKKKLLKAIQNIPDIEDEGLKFFIKYADKSTAEIASRLVTPSFITCEHIKPKSKGGEDNTANYLAECEECNSKRNDAPLLQYVTNVSVFINNLKNYFGAITQKFQLGEISDKYSTYLEDISKTIANETQGKINLTPPKIEQTNFENENDVNEKIALIEKMLESQLKELEEAKKLQAEISKDEQHKLISEYLALKSKKEALEAKRKIKKEEVNRKKTFLSKFYKKITELENKKRELKYGNLTAKERQNLETQVNKIKSFLDSKNSEILEAQLKTAQNELFKIQDDIRQTENKLNSLEEKIIFPENIKKEIDLLKAQLYEIKRLKEQIANLNSIINDSADIQERIKEKENQIQALLLENQKIDISDNGENDLDTYKKMTEVIKRAEEVESQNQNNKFTGTDSLVYQLAKQKAKEILSHLIEISGPVKIQKNLDRISQILSELNSYYTLLNKNQANEIKRNELLEKLNSMPKESELEAKISTLKQQYEKAKTNFSSIDLDNKIKNLEKTIVHKRKILSKIKKAKSNTEIQQLLYEL